MAQRPEEVPQRMSEHDSPPSVVEQIRQLQAQMNALAGRLASLLKLKNKGGNDPAMNNGLFIQPLKRVFEDRLGAQPRERKRKCGPFAKNASANEK